MSIVFFICAAVMAIALALWAVMPLLRQGQAGGAVRRAAANRAVYQDQLRQLDVDLRAGTLSQSQYDEARREIDQRVVHEVAEQPAAVQVSRHRGRTAALAITAMVPLVAGVLYWRLGNPDAIEQTVLLSGGAQEVAVQTIEATLQKLETRLEQNPGQPEVWIMLARNYYHLRRFDQASRAYARAAGLRVDDADLLADYADALAMSQDRRIEGKPLELVNRALQIDPGQWKALAMAATAASERGDYSSAADYWEKLRAQAAPDSEMSRSLSASIAEARRLADARPAGSKKPAPSGQ